MSSRLFCNQMIYILLKLTFLHTFPFIFDLNYVLWSICRTNWEKKLIILPYSHWYMYFYQKLSQIYSIYFFIRKITHINLLNWFVTDYLYVSALFHRDISSNIWSILVLSSEVDPKSFYIQLSVLLVILFPMSSIYWFKFPNKLSHLRKTQRKVYFPRGRGFLLF